MCQPQAVAEAFSTTRAITLILTRTLTTPLSTIINIIAIRNETTTRLQR